MKERTTFGSQRENKELEIIPTEKWIINKVVASNGDIFTIDPETFILEHMPDEDDGRYYYEIHNTVIGTIIQVYGFIYVGLVKVQ